MHLEDGLLDRPSRDEPIDRRSRPSAWLTALFRRADLALLAAPSSVASSFADGRLSLHRSTRFAHELLAVGDCLET